LRVGTLLGDILHDLLKVTLKHRALGTRQMPQRVNQRAEDEQLEEGVQDMKNKGDNRGQAYLRGSLHDEGEMSNHRRGEGRVGGCGPLIYTIDHIGIQGKHYLPYLVLPFFLISSY
jgi:hypothetical protein